MQNYSKNNTVISLIYDTIKKSGIFIKLSAKKKPLDLTSKSNTYSGKQDTTSKSSSWATPSICFHTSVLSTNNRLT